MTDLGHLTKGWELLQVLRPLPSSVVEELGHRYSVRLTHHSTAIEGNTLSQSETAIVIEKGITIAGKTVEEHFEVIGHKEALDFVFALADGSEPIGEWQIREIHSLVMKGQGNGDTGRYRNLDVRAAGTDFVYPSHLHLPELMRGLEVWLREPSDLHPVHRASEAHLRFVTIHPFRDGNGRVGRLLMNLLLLRSGYPIAVIPVERRVEYIDALVAAQAGRGHEDLDSLIAQAVLESLRDTLESCLGSEDVVAVHAAAIAGIRTWLSA